MKWMLVVIGIFNGEVVATNEGVYENMIECFYEREEYVWTTFGNADGYPPTNFEVVCIPTDKY